MEAFECKQKNSSNGAAKVIGAVEQLLGGDSGAIFEGGEALVEFEGTSFSFAGYVNLVVCRQNGGVVVSSSVEEGDEQHSQVLPFLVNKSNGSAVQVVPIQYNPFQGWLVIGRPYPVSKEDGGCGWSNAPYPVSAASEVLITISPESHQAQILQAITEN